MLAPNKSGSLGELRTDVCQFGELHLDEFIL